MGKNKAKKGDGSNARSGHHGGDDRRRVPAAQAAGDRVDQGHGEGPPTDLTDPKVTLVEALAWSVATGIVVETARFAIVRSTMRKSLADAGAESS